MDGWQRWQLRVQVGRSERVQGEGDKASVGALNLTGLFGSQGRRLKY